MKRLCYLYPFDFHVNYLEKDVGLIPKYFSRKFGVEVDFLLFNDYYSFNELNEMKSKYSHLNFVVFNRWFSKKTNRPHKLFEVINQMAMVLHCIKNINKYDYLFMFHFSLLTWLYATIARKLNKNIKMFIKLDIDTDNAIRISNPKPSRMKKWVLGSLVKKSNFISCETTQTYQILKNGIYGENVSEKLIYLPNGIDNDISTFYSKEEIIELKENILLTVGRLGEYQKNTELFLESLKELDLTNWKAIFIGTMTKEFVQYKNQFLKENPNLMDKVIFTGPIYDRATLCEYFAKAKCFVLTSRFESYGLVLNEAYTFMNYIISTDVGAARDIVCEGEVGVLIEHSSQDLTKHLAFFKDNSNDILKDMYRRVDRENFTWDSILDNTVEISHFFKRDN
jgi:GalNAc-alpha-(1->4)-GalNAc-alpha-(1->3)-diNAcBac-PP-undecaprenol alpha-1,4-N-acetyl-D-galactosaminyltransferase